MGCPGCMDNALDKYGLSRVKGQHSGQRWAVRGIWTEHRMKGCPGYLERTQYFKWVWAPKWKAQSFLGEKYLLTSGASIECRPSDSERIFHPLTCRPLAQRHSVWLARHINKGVFARGFVFRLVALPRSGCVCRSASLQPCSIGRFSTGFFLPACDPPTWWVCVGTQAFSRTPMGVCTGGFCDRASMSVVSTGFILPACTPPT